MMPAVSADLSKRLVPDELWELVAPLPPTFAARPQGGGTAPRDERAVFTAVVYVLTSGCAWRAASAADVRQVLRHRTSPLHGMDRGRPVASAASGGAGRTRGPGRGGLDLGDRRCDLRSRQKGESLTGPNQVDRGKKGSKLHVLSDAQGIPLAVAVSGANMHDSLALKPLILGIPAVRSRRGPRRRRPIKLRADKAYFSWPGDTH
jgi:transposase